MRWFLERWRMVREWYIRNEGEPPPTDRYGGWWI